MAEPYECTLDAATQQKAKQELYEDPKNRQGAIDTFRQWILQQKHISCPTDDVFLLGFLRAKHFSQLEARQGLELFMKARTKLQDWMINLDPADPEIEEIIDVGVSMTLQGRDDECRRIGIFRPGVLDGGNKRLVRVYCRLFGILGYYHYMCEELTQVHGTATLMDWAGQTMANEVKMPLEVRKNITLMLTKAFPARVKGLHMCNAGSLLEFLMGIISSLLNDKLKKRLHVHKHGLEGVYKHIPMRMLPNDYLPDDYHGPSAGSLQQVKDALKAELQQAEIRERIKYLSSDKFYIKLEDKDKEEPATSFRKLNVD